MSTPLQNNLFPFANRVRNGNAKMCVLGDSLSSQGTAPRNIGGIMRTWDVPMRGVWIPGYTLAPGEGGITYSAPATAGVAPGGTYPHKGGTNDLPVGTLESLYGAIARFAANYRPAMSKTVVDACARGNWVAQDEAMSVRYLYFQTGEEPVNTNVLTRRGDGSSSVQHSSLDMRTYGTNGVVTIDSNFVSFIDFDQAECDWYLQCNANEAAGAYIIHIGSLMYLPNVNGLQLISFAQGGWNVTDHLDPGANADGKYTDAGLETFLPLIGSPDLFMIQIGQNDGSLTKAQYKTHLAAVIARYKARCTAIGVTDPLFLLVSTWDTSDTNTRFIEYAEAQYEISVADPTVATVDLRQKVEIANGAWSTWKATYLQNENPNWIHQLDTDAADYFMGLVWDEIVLARPMRNRITRGYPTYLRSPSGVR